MTSLSTPGALVAYGWSERVATLYRAHPDAGRPDALPARITRVERGACVLVGPSGVERSVPTGDLVVATGDWVVATGAPPSASDPAGRPGASAPNGQRTEGAIGGRGVLAVLERWSTLERRDPDTGRPQVLAADVDLVVVTVPADRPSANRVEREVTLACASGARVVVALTKADLAAAGLADRLAGRLVGIDVIPTSAGTGLGVDRLAGLFAPDRTGVLLGPSGAGKSSLTNALAGADLQDTGAVREADRRGRHTTSSRQLIVLPAGGVVIDTPGLRSLGLLSAESVADAFPDVGLLAGDCRFRDCAHLAEPGCAVAAAVAAGGLDPQRLANYRALLAEGAAEARRNDPPARREARRAWKQRSRETRREDERR